MLVFLRDARVFINRKPTTPLNHAQLALSKRSDFFMPLRESSSSRLIFNNHMDLMRARTRGGLFSLLLYRGISFNTGCFSYTPPQQRTVSIIYLLSLGDTVSNDNQIWFDTLQDWKTYRANLKAYFSIPTNVPAEFRRSGLSDVFWCNANAYGQYLKDRTEAQDDKFWELSQSVDWPDPAWPQFPIPFVTMLKWVQHTKKSKPHLMASMGTLSIYLFVADMYPAGLVQLPTVNDMGPIINQLNAGAVKGLTLLGYLPPEFKADTSTK